MVSARLAVTSAGELAYSVFQQGFGLVNAYELRIPINSDT